MLLKHSDGVIIKCQNVVIIRHWNCSASDLLLNTKLTLLSYIKLKEYRFGRLSLYNKISFILCDNATVIIPKQMNGAYKYLHTNVDAIKESNENKIEMQ